MNDTRPTTATSFELPIATGMNPEGNDLWTLSSPERSVIEADSGSDLGPAVRIHEILDQDMGGFPYTADQVEALGLALVAAARAARSSAQPERQP